MRKSTHLLKLSRIHGIILAHMEKINPQKYIDLAAKVQQEAKEAAIALLRDKVEGHCIDPDFSTFTGGTTILPAIGYTVLKAMIYISSFMHMA